ncbi:ABC transporter substrate-binding protein, partial [Myxococcota bacterium]
MRRLAFVIALFACSAAWAQPKGPEYLGGKRPKGVPGRVVSLAPNLTEILFAIGAGERVVGVTTYDDYPEEVKKLPRVGGFIDPSVEAILALKPDLVICVPNPGGRNRMDALSRMGVPILVLPSYRMKDIFTVIRTLGNLFDRKEAAKKLIADMQARIDRIAKLVEDVRRPKVLLVYGHRPIMAAGKGSFGDTMLKLAGGENVIKDSGVRYPNVPMEEVIRLMPEVIIDASSSGTGAEMTRVEVEKVWGRWKVLPAVKNRRVYIFNSALWFRPGPRVAQGLEKLFLILHP